MLMWLLPLLINLSPLCLVPSPSVISMSKVSNHPAPPLQLRPSSYPFPPPPPPPPPPLLLHLLLLFFFFFFFFFLLLLLLLLIRCIARGVVCDNPSYAPDNSLVGALTEDKALNIHHVMQKHTTLAIKEPITRRQMFTIKMKRFV